MRRSEHEIQGETSLRERENDSIVTQATSEEKRLLVQEWQERNSKSKYIGICNGLPF